MIYKEYPKNSWRIFQRTEWQNWSLYFVIIAFRGTLCSCVCIRDNSCYVSKSKMRYEQKHRAFILFYSIIFGQIRTQKQDSYFRKSSRMFQNLYGSTIKKTIS